MSDAPTPHSIALLRQEQNDAFDRFTESFDRRLRVVEAFMESQTVDLTTQAGKAVLAAAAEVMLTAKAPEPEPAADTIEIGTAEAEASARLDGEDEAPAAPSAPAGLFFDQIQAEAAPSESPPAPTTPADPA